MARSTSLEHRKVMQAKALLVAGDGAANEEIARRCPTTPDTVRRWRARFVEEGVAGIGSVRPGRGRKSWVGASVAAAVVHDTLHEAPPGGETQWSTRLMAARHGIGKDTVHRIWRARGIRPHLVERFKISADPDFEASSSTSSGCTWIRRSGRWWCAGTKRPRSRPWTAPSRRCPASGARRDDDP
jgi:transposase